jgi:HNH endonuclease
MSRVRPSQREKLRERAHGCCEACGSPGATNAHHRINQSQGGLDDLANLMLLCGSGTTGCHGTVTESPHLARWMGYTLSSHQDPARSHVCRWSRELGGQQWVLLDDDGGINPVTEVVAT